MVEPQRPSQVRAKRPPDFFKELKEHQPVRTPPHLFPEKACQRATTGATTQVKQASQCDQKQGQVGEYHGDKTKYAEMGLDWNTGKLRRVPCKVDLRMG
jgi:hypothetical protein